MKYDLRLFETQLTRTSSPSAEINSLIRDLKGTHDTLTEAIKAEERQSMNDKPDHYAYSPLAQSIRVRREKVAQSIKMLENTLERLSRFPGHPAPGNRQAA